MRLVEVRLLDGPNVYRLEPTVKLEVAVGRRRTWYGERNPQRHAVVRLGRPVSTRQAPAEVVDLARWVRTLHRLTDSARWLADEPDRDRRRRLPVTLHRTTDPGHWVVAFPWRDGARAKEIAEAAARLVERGITPDRTHQRRRDGRSPSRTLLRALAAIRRAQGPAPAWVRDTERRLPIVSISGTNGKSTTTRMITHIMRACGKRVGTTTSDGVLVDETLVEAGDWTGPGGAKQVLDRPEVEVAVLETARGGIVLRGLGYESNEASVITNISADHLDLHGLHTLPELAEVKAVVCRVTRPSGRAVLNGDDPLLVAVARTVRAPVCFFSLEPTSRHMRRHLAAGGQAMLLEDGWFVEAHGGARERILAVAEAPTALFGVARHNIANALAAAGAARALGASREQVAAGLRSFRPSHDQAPGRLNLYRVGDRLVIVDFAHNEAGVTVVLDVAEALAGGPRGTARRRPVTMIAGTAGDRPDDALRGIGRIAAERADRLAIKETRRYLRGRTRESVIGEILAGMVSGGARRRDVPVYESEPVAIREVLAAGSGDPEVILLMCHEDREGVAREIEAAGGRAVDVIAELGELLGTAP